MPYARGGFATLLCLLAIQFLLGMYNNLYVNLADPRHPTATIAGHIVLGVLLAAIAALTTIAAGLARRAALALTALCGLTATVVAIVTGFNFLNTSDDAYSATMAVGFVLTAIFDVIGLLLANKAIAGDLRRAARRQDPS